MFRAPVVGIEERRQEKTSWWSLSIGSAARRLVWYGSEYGSTIGLETLGLVSMMMSRRGAKFACSVALPMMILYKNVEHPKLAAFIKEHTWVMESEEYLTFP